MCDIFSRNHTLSQEIFNLLIYASRKFELFCSPAPGAAPTPCCCSLFTSTGGWTSPTCSPSWPGTRVSTLYPCLITNQISRHLTFCFVDYSENRQKTFFCKIVTELIAYYDYLYRLPVQHQMFGGRRSRLVCCVLSSCLGWFVILKITKPYECGMKSDTWLLWV